MTNDLYLSLKNDILGLEHCDKVARFDGGTEQKRRIYLDTTATALMPKLVWKGLERYLSTACANSHTEAHRAGRSTTRAIDEARDAVGRLVGATAADVVVFNGNGATGAINFLARALFPPELRMPVKRSTPERSGALVAAMQEAFPQGKHALDAMLERPLVVTTLMEHHSNILPWIEAVGRHNVRFVGVRPDGSLDLDHLQALLDREGHRVRLLAVTGASNVTGLINPIHDIAARAHAVGAQILVDAAQLAPHRRIDMGNLDFLVISGHKLYAPGSRGVLVGKLDVLSGRRCVGDVGGGMVEYVSVEDFRVKQEVTAREEAGTPNIPGTISLGLIAEALSAIGMDRIEHDEEELVGYALDQWAPLDGVTIYGSHNPGARVGVFALNLEGLHHGLVAAFLDDYYNIATRNECFCAHPYVKALLHVDAAEEKRYLSELECGDRRHVPGMVRLSLGIYSRKSDIEVAKEALGELWRHRQTVLANYQPRFDGAWRREGIGEEKPLFSTSQMVQRAHHR